MKSILFIIGIIFLVLFFISISFMVLVFSIFEGMPDKLTKTLNILIYIIPLIYTFIGGYHIYMYFNSGSLSLLYYLIPIGCVIVFTIGASFIT